MAWQQLVRSYSYSHQNTFGSLTTDDRIFWGDGYTTRPSPLEDDLGVATEEQGETGGCNRYEHGNIVSIEGALKE